MVRDPTFDYHKDLHKRYLHFSPNHLVSEAQDSIEANAKAAAAAAEQEALDLLPWDDSKHTRKDLEKLAPGSKGTACRTMHRRVDHREQQVHHAARHGWRCQSVQGPGQGQPPLHLLLRCR